MKLLDLFPLCNDKECPEYQRHKHPLRNQTELINSEEKYVYEQGGYGSAKTLAACILGLTLTLKIPDNRGVIARKSYPDLHDSTQRVFMEVLARSGVRWRGRENRDGWYHRIIFPGNRSEVLFRETQTMGRFLGSEYGWWYLDEALEMPEIVFKRLQGRLRLPQAGDYLKGIVTSNPPNETHWLHKIFGKEPGRREVSVDMGRGLTEISTYRFIKSSTRRNPHNPPGYLADLLTGLAAHEIARVVDGEYGFTPEGPQALQEFRHGDHVGEPSLNDFGSLIRGWDFGYRHPAVTFHQFFLCVKRKPHWHILAEIDGDHIEALPFGRSVINYTRARFPSAQLTMVEDAGDQQGAQVSDKGEGPIIQLGRPPYGLQIMYKYCPPEQGIRMIRDFLNIKICECGEVPFQIHRQCKNTIDALAGGYHLRMAKPGVAGKEEPVKDGFYDDYIDSVRYAAEHYLREMLEDPEIIRRLDATDPRVMLPGRGDAWQRGMQELMRQDRKEGRY